MTFEIRRRFFSHSLLFGSTLRTTWASSTFLCASSVFVSHPGLSTSLRRNLSYRIYSYDPILRPHRHLMSSTTLLALYPVSGRTTLLPPLLFHLQSLSAHLSCPTLLFLVGIRVSAFTLGHIFAEDLWITLFSGCSRDFLLAAGVLIPSNCGHCRISTVSTSPLCGLFAFTATLHDPA